MSLASVLRLMFTGKVNSEKNMLETARKDLGLFDNIDMNKPYI